MERLGIIMHGVTGRMGMNQHLLRSILPLRDEGGLLLADGSRVAIDPIIVGRNAAKIRALAEAHGIARWTTDLDAALADPDDTIFFDAGSTRMRAGLLRRAIDAGKHVYCEKPIAESLEEALTIARHAQKAGIASGVVHDKLYLPGLRKLAMLKRGGFFGRILSVRIEFGYWVFAGDLQPTQRPSWNYKAAEGGGVILDMMAHWRYVLDHVVAPVRAVSCLGATHLLERRDEEGRVYVPDVDDAFYATLELEGGIVAQVNASWCTRVRRDDLVTFHIDGTDGSAVAGLHRCWTQGKVNTPRPVWNPDLPQPLDLREHWSEVPETQVCGNGFREQWEAFLRHVVEGAPWAYGLMEGAKGVQLAELALQSWRERRWLDVGSLEESGKDAGVAGHAGDVR